MRIETSGEFKERKQKEKEAVFEQARKSGKRRLIDYVLIGIIVLAVCVVAFCVYKLVGISNSYSEAENQYNEIDELFAEPPETTVEIETTVKEIVQTSAAENESESAAETTVQETTEQATAAAVVEAKFYWDFNKLLAVNPDSVGYIRQSGTAISYPIVQCGDNSTYLTTMINGNYNGAGTIFVDCNFSSCLDGRYSIVYGHNMKDGSMFGSLHGYEYESYYQSHPTFDIYIGENHYKYQVFSAFTASAGGFAYRYYFGSDEEYYAFLEELKTNSLYDTGVDVSGASNVILLSTCVSNLDENYRFVVALTRTGQVD